MKRKTDRRKFVSNLAIAVMGSLTLGACTGKGGDKKSGPTGSSVGNDLKNTISENKKMPRDLVMKMLDQKVNNYMQISYNCAQSSFFALDEQFGLNGESVLKALTPLTGIAERGETCGAIVGSLMAFGLIYGRDKNKLNNWDIYRESLIPSGKFCNLFEKEFGSTMCRDIQNVKYGRSFNLMDPSELKEFQKADATNKCSAVVRRAVHIAANIILDEYQETGPDL